MATTVTMATPQTMAEAGEAMDLAMQREERNGAGDAAIRCDGERDRIQKAPPRDYAADFSEAPRRAIEQDRAEQDITEQDMAEQLQGPEQSLFPEAAGEPERDLDVPTFMRRLKF